MRTYEYECIYIYIYVFERMRVVCAACVCIQSFMSVHNVLPVIFITVDAFINTAIIVIAIVNRI